MNKFLFIILTTLFLSACSQFYAYQPPAPIYNKTTPTNPYEDLSNNTTKTIENTNKTEPAKKQNPPFLYKAPSNSHNNTLPSTKPSSPAIIALVLEAEKNSKAGDLESAASTIERALRIDSRNPSLTYKLAKLRLQQSKPRLAESLAQKAALLSAQDKILKRQSWLLISEARKQQNNFYGAKEAKLKADKI